MYEIIHDTFIEESLLLHTPVLKLSEYFQDLYHEHYDCIAVMFASIPNYKEFYDENDVNKQGDFDILHVDILL